MKKNILLIANPVAGRARIRKNIKKIEKNLLKNNEFNVDLRYTTIKNNATKIINQYAENLDILFVCGGDGTLNEAIEALCESKRKIPIAYVPIGTTNDFAKSLRIPFNMLKLSKNMHSTSIKEVDIGKFNNRYFNYVISTGLFSKTSYKTPSRLKNRFGRLAYILSGVREIFSYKTQRLKLKIDDKVIEDEFIYGSISNSNYIGGFKLFKKDKNVKLDDGKFEIIFVKKPKNSFGFLTLIFKILTGRFTDKNIYYFKSDKITIESDNYCEYSIDGEYSGKIKKVEISNINKFARYFIL